tara:strand:- start:729 stop:1595 length:867 start_codon:yes stop_codon:yes gene_type:complete
MKSQFFKGTINEGSNELYASSEYNVDARNGTFVKIGENEIFYQIETSKELNLKKRFESHVNHLTIKGDYRYKISPGDNAKLYFNETEAVSVTKIVNGGKNHHFGNLFYVKGGFLSNTSDKLNGQPTILKVTSTKKNKSVQEVQIENPGRYLTPPENPVTAKDEDGNVIQLEMEFDQAAETSIFERDFKNVQYKDGKTFLHLNYAFPEEVKTGELILSKSVIYLSREYAASSVTNTACQTCEDFSPINKIPLMPPRTISAHSIYNKAMETIDQRFLEMEKRLTRLENRN